MTYNSRLFQRSAPFLIAVPILCFWAFLFTYATNIPWMDDMESFVYFQLGYMKADTIADKIEWLLKPNNEHRILFAKLVATGMQALTGQLDFRWLILIASLWLAGILLLFYRVFKTIQAPLIAFLPIVLLLLHPQYYLITLSAVTSYQHQTAVCLVLLTAYLLAKPGGGRFSWALVFQILASFSMSNGLFGWIGGTGTLLVQRRYKEAILWLGIGGATIYFYLHGFANAQGNESSISFFFKNPHQVFLGFFTFSGAILDFFPSAPILPRSILPTLAGFALIGAFLWLLKRMLLPWPPARSQPNPKEVCRNFLVGGYVFLMVNAAIIAFLRPRFGYSVMLISNYTMYSSLLAILIYINVLSELSSQRTRSQWLTAGLVLSITVWGVMYFRNWPRVAERKQMFEAFAFNQKHNGIGLGASLGTQFAPLSKQWMNDAVAAGLYQYPTGFYTPYETALLQPAAGKPVEYIPLSIEEVPEWNWDVVRTVNWPVPAHLSNACIIAKSAQWTYLFPVSVLFNPKPFYAGSKIPALESNVLKTSLYPGRYQLGILMHPLPNAPIRYLNQWVTVP